MDDDDRNKRRDSPGVATRYMMSTDAEITSAQRAASAATSSRRRKANRHSGRRPLLKTPGWLNMSPSPHRNHSSVSAGAVCGPFRYPPPYMRQYSYPMASLPSSLKHRRCTDVRFASSDREWRQSGAPAWMSEVTPRQRRGAMSLHCCVAIVSRWLHAAGARHYAERVAEDCERQRRITDAMYDNNDDDEDWTSSRQSGVDNTGRQDTSTTVSDAGRDEAGSRHASHTQPIDAQQNDDRKQRTLENQPSCSNLSKSSRSASARDSISEQRKDARRKARNRSDSDSDSSHRPCVRDLRYRPPNYRPRGVQNRRSTPYYETWQNRRRTPRDTHTHGRRSATHRSSADRKSQTEKLRKNSMSSERSSLSSDSSVSSRGRRNNKDQPSASKHSSADGHGDNTKDTKTTTKTPQTATENAESESLHKNTPASTSSHEVDSAIGIDGVKEENSDNASVSHGYNSHGEPTLNAGQTSDIGNEISTDSSSIRVRPSENYATSDSGLKSPLSDTVFRPKTPTPDNSEVSKVERQGSSRHSHDSSSVRTPGEGDWKHAGADRSGISPHRMRRRHSRGGSRPRSRNNRLSVEATKSENNDSYGHEHRTESTSESHEKRKRQHSGRRNRSRSDDRRKRRSSRHGSDHEYRTTSRYDRHDRRRSRGRRRSRSSSRGRNSSSSSSDNDRSSSSKRNRKNELPYGRQDQLTDNRRIKAERKRLEKLQKKAEKALRKIQQLELNYKETNLHWKKPNSREMSTATALPCVSQDTDLLDVNSNKCDWKSAEIRSDKVGCNTSLSVVDVDFIASYTSPVSSPSVTSETEAPNSNDKPESLLDQTSSDKQCAVNERQADLKNGSEYDVTTCVSSEQATNVIPPSCTVATSAFASSVANDRSIDERLLDSELYSDWAVSETMTMMTSYAVQTVAVAGEGKSVQLESNGLQIPVRITTETNFSP